MQTKRTIVVKYAHRLWERGWVANHDGNITVKIDKYRLLATPTAFSKKEILPDDLVTYDVRTGKVTGRHRVFSEVILHLEYYRVREDISAVVHAHPPYSTTLAVAGIEIEPCILPEPVVSLGDRIPLAPPVFPGSLMAKEQIRGLGKLYDVILLGNHGVIACGDSVEQAYLRMELCEHIARIQFQAMQLGALRLVPDEWIPELLKKRKKAGLGPDARGIKITQKKPDLSKLPADQIVKTIVEQLSKQP